MVAESGARLLDHDAQLVLLEQIVPRATVLTPNVPEARILAGKRVDMAGLGLEGQADLERGRSRLWNPPGPTRPDSAAEFTDADFEELARAVLALGPRTVVLTGGHRARTVDLLVDSEDAGAAVEIPGVRHPEGAAHGSGCTHSSVLAAQLALGRTPLQAARVARRLAGEAVARGLRDIGAGAGPVDIIGLERLRGGIIEER